MTNWSDRTYRIILLIIGIIFFIPFLGAVHLFDWDEINFAESAREMIVSKDYLTVQINFSAFWEKPPLFIWFQVLSMKLFGINEFAARCPNAIAGIATMLVFFQFGKKLHESFFGFIWAILYAASLLPFFYFKSGIIDPWFNLFIFAGIYYAYCYFNENDRKSYNSALSGLFIGLSVLTKGPVGLLLFGLTTFVFLIVKKFRVQTSIKDIVIYLGVFVFVGGFWFILQLLSGNFDVIVDFFVYQVRLFQTKDAGHGGFLFYHFVVLFFGVFPLSIFALPNLWNFTDKSENQQSFKIWMQILFWVVLILFTIVKTKIIHYSSLAYFPLSYLGAIWFYMKYKSKDAVAPWQRNCFLGTGIFLALAFSAFPIIDLLKESIIAKGWVSDEFAIAQFQATLQWKGFEIFIGVLMLMAVILGFVQLKNARFNSFLKSTVVLFMVCYFTLILFLVPRAEEYSQKVYIDFLEEVQNEDAYIRIVHMKSYAPYFYGKVQPSESKKNTDWEWLINGDIDKPVYFILRNKRKANFMQEVPEARFLKEENGYVFMKRELPK